MNLQKAVELALEHNHDVRISSLKVQEDEHAREVARSAYLPVLRNDTSFICRDPQLRTGSHRLEPRALQSFEEIGQRIRGG
jgi:outer membrane protein TolC